MKFYIAARFGLKEKVREIYKKLKDKGHDVTLDWTLHKSIKPYDKNQELAEKYSIQVISGVRESDIFILLTNEAGTGMYVEFGIALASYLDNKKPDIYLVGEHTNRSMFYFHPAINKRNNIDDLLKEFGI